MFALDRVAARLLAERPEWPTDEFHSELSRGDGNTGTALASATLGAKQLVKRGVVAQKAGMYCQGPNFPSSALKFQVPTPQSAPVVPSVLMNTVFQMDGNAQVPAPQQSAARSTCSKQSESSSPAPQDSAVAIDDARGKTDQSQLIARSNDEATSGQGKSWLTLLQAATGGAAGAARNRSAGSTSHGRSSARQNTRQTTLSSSKSQSTRQSTLSSRTVSNAGTTEADASSIKDFSEAVQNEKDETKQEQAVQNAKDEAKPEKAVQHTRDHAKAEEVDIQMDVEDEMEAAWAAAQVAAEFHNSNKYQLQSQQPPPQHERLSLVAPSTTPKDWLQAFRKRCQPQPTLPAKRRVHGTITRAAHDTGPGDRSECNGSELKIISKLSPEQKQVACACMEGRNVFFTGLPGTGKSYCLNAIIDLLKPRLRNGELAVCASTGAAACLVGGGTLHSFLGCGLGKSKEDWDRMWGAKRLHDVKTLVVDEISMIPGGFLEQASSMLSKIRHNPAPFGGMQVIICGDFMQLPPVDRDGSAGGFAFEAPCWNDLKLGVFELTQNFRQSEDDTFASILRRLRVGDFNSADRQLLEQPRAVNSEQSTRLYCHNAAVDQMNNQKLAALPGEAVQYVKYDWVERNQSALLKNCERSPLPEKLQLKVGARVMLLKNIRLPSQCSKGQPPLVNGTVGTVVRFETIGYIDDGIRTWAAEQTSEEVKLPVLRLKGGNDQLIRPENSGGEIAGIGKYNRQQLPLRLAWAVSVHKSQGATLDEGVVDLRGAFEEGQVYVALSRFRSLDKISIVGLPQSLRVSQKAREFHDKVSRTQHTSLN
eukprot:gnl/MRDRNA2_/MRDRNA2_27790_c0_seq1.p1 gnl/MRDRNA2_/MRDRNA2_27790_c0~~gnl/MRDRNA2_/MRDRNA2_27790_c0_seq1.p1  ORF type:complete len:819 (-),score=178.20 gnl/MRDRNA2_/MRDRNA2_27790_c0_seq1:49-2505(-)